MLSSRSFLTTFLFFVSAGFVSADSHLGSKSHHVGKRHDLNLERRNGSDASIEKRFDDAKFTTFAPGVNACGSVDSPSDFIVAMGVEQFGTGGNCYKPITITYNGKTLSATITDRCAICPYGGLDLSPALFGSLADPNLGVIYGSWDFADAAPPPSSSPSPTPTPTPTPPPPPPTSSTHKTTSTPPPPPPSSSSSVHKTSSSHPPSSSSTTSTSSSVPPTTSSAAPTSTSTSSSVASAAPTPVFQQGVVEQLNLVLINFGAIVVDGN